MATLLVHSSDLHIDDAPPDAKYTGLMGLRAVLDAARTADADFLLLAGDTFDNHRVSTATLRRTADLLATAGRPVILLPGNHDPLLPDCLFQRAGFFEIPGIHVFGITEQDAIGFTEQGLEIIGRPHRGYGDMPPFHPPRPRALRWQVVMAHGHYVPPDEWRAVAHNSWRIADADIAATGADYVALGHWDRPAPVGDGRVPAYYSGSPDLAGTVNLIRLCPTTGVTVSRVALDWRQPDRQIASQTIP
jgi:DNA repair exonuclease SbcCD nuclease subunit